MQHIIIRNFRAVFARAFSTPRAKRKAPENAWITIWNYIHLARRRGLHLARNFTGNPCGINGGNAQFKPRYAARKSVEYRIWDCLRLTEYASSWSNGNDLVIRITINASVCFSAKSSLRFNIASNISPPKKRTSVAPRERYQKMYFPNQFFRVYSFICESSCHVTRYYQENINNSFKD